MEETKDEKEMRNTGEELFKETISIKVNDSKVFKIPLNDSMY